MNKQSLLLLALAASTASCTSEKVLLHPGFFRFRLEGTEEGESALLVKATVENGSDYPVRTTTNCRYVEVKYSSASGFAGGGTRAPGSMEDLEIMVPPRERALLLMRIREPASSAENIELVFPLALDTSPSMRFRTSLTVRKHSGVTESRSDDP